MLRGTLRRAGASGLRVSPRPMNRRAFLTRSATLAAAGFCLPQILAAEPGAAPAKASRALSPRATEFIPLRRGAGYFTGRGGAIGWLASPEALVVVDTQYAETAGLCLAGLPGRSERLVDVVFNTHHHKDHTSGNEVFKKSARMIVAQKNVPKLQLRDAERVGDTYKQVFADTLFDDVWRRELGDEVVTAQSVGPAHTGGDAVVCFERANVVHLGDLVFNRTYPVIDRVGGADIRGWLAALELVAQDFPEDAVLIFSHANARFGHTGGRPEVLLMRDYLSALLDRAGKAIAAGQSRDELVRLGNMPGFDDFHVPPGRGNRLPANLAAAFDELSGVAAPSGSPLL